MEDNLTPEQRIRKAAEELGLPVTTQEEIDRIQTYHMEQYEQAEELYRSAVADGVNFAMANDEGEVFVNVHWLGLIVKTLAEAVAIGGDEDGHGIRTAEILGQTVLASNKFVGKA